MTLQTNSHKENTKPSGMQSLRQLYRIGKGPSSSHTIGPEKICKIFSELNSNADSFRVILYGSLAQTGKGHGTERIIEKTLYPKKTQIEYDYTELERRALEKRKKRSVGE